jgi:hypothetical protein
MARKVILDTYYTFTSSSKTIVFNQAIPRERFVLITNIITNQVIYNFSDPNLRFTSHSISTNPTTGLTTTTVVLNYNTAAMSSADELQVVVDEYDEKFTPSELYTDPVNKFRVSMPQALIDTDFEYGTQSTKWETIGLLNNKPYAYANLNSTTSGSLVVTDITAVVNSPTIIVTTATPPVVNTPVIITDTNWPPAEGTFMVESVVTGTSFRYSTKQRYASVTNTNQSIFIPNATQVANGSIFNRANTPIANVNTPGGLANCFITTTQPHGLTIGNQVVLQGLLAGTSANPNGTFTVTQVVSNTVFRIDANTPPVGGVTASGFSAMYSISRGTVTHRAYDGGVEFSTSAESHNNQLIRQTRRYFRYQSGKGVQVSTGTLLKPSMRVDSMTSSGTLITVKTKDAHFMSPNVVMTISGADQTGYNGSYSVNQVIDPFTFTYISSTTPSTATATGTYRVSANNWYGAANRMGLFDDQNGIFFEFDGQTLSAVRRNSVFQLAGFISANTGNNTITGVTVNGSTTNFSGQLNPGDYVVIKGMSYRVENIRSNQVMEVQPNYRGEANTLQAVISKTVETRVPQSQWNIDRCDGTGPSGFNIDLTRMQMFYMDYSWYGAGFVRWGLRGPDGNVIYCHKMINNNINYEAHMRSGNLPGRYETNTFAKKTKLNATLLSTDTTLNVADASAFPTTGTVWVNGQGLSEFINYNGITGSAANGYVLAISLRGQPGNTINCIMNTSNATLNLVAGSTTVGIQPGMYIQNNANIPQSAVIASITPNVSITLSQAPVYGGIGPVTFIPMGNTATTFNYSSTAPIAVDLHGPGYSPRISHWGTSVIMDGRYDDDKSLVFTQGMTTQANVAAGQTLALQSFRVAPSVSNGIAGASLGVREIKNTMQLVLRTLDMLSSGTFLVQIVLNGATSNATPTWTSVGGSSLVQYINHTVSSSGTAAGTNVAGGEVIFAGFTNASGGANFSTTTYDLPLVRDLGNSILGGGTALPSTNFYPDGPDIVTIIARNISTTGSANIFTRLSWTEAQA